MGMVAGRYECPSCHGTAHLRMVMIDSVIYIFYHNKKNWEKMRAPFFH